MISGRSIGSDTLGKFGWFFIPAAVCMAWSAVAQDIPVSTLESMGEYETEKNISVLSEDAEETTEYPEFIEELLNLEDEPLNLNTASREELCRLLLLSDLQAFNLVAYRETYGPLVTIYELQAVDGFDARTIRRTLPFILLGPSGPAYKVTIRHVAAYGKHEFLFRLQRVLERRAGYRDAADNAGFLGTPERLYLRYGFNYKNRIRFGFTAEKDPGEPLLPGINTRMPGDSSQRNVLPPFDYMSFYLSLSTAGIIKSLIVGDFQVTAGQGLTLGSAGTFGPGGNPAGIRQTRDGLRPHRGTEENRFFRGAGIVMGRKRFHTLFLFSINRLDARHTTDTLSGVETTSFRLDYSGYHRTPAELANRNSLALTTLAARIRYGGNRARIGASMVRWEYAFPVQGVSSYYGIYQVPGKVNHCGGVDYHYLIRRFSFFGETSMGMNGSMAHLHGLAVNLLPGFDVSVLYRDYQAGFVNPFSHPFSAGQGFNERGIYTGFGLQLPRSVFISGFIDVYEFPWLKYRVDRPSRGRALLLMVEGKPADGVSMVLRVKYRDYQINEPESQSFVAPLQTGQKTQFRIETAYPVSGTISMRDRIEFVRRHWGGGGDFSGFLAIHDIRCRLKKERLIIDLRYALFDTDTYNERIYAYEQDVLYAFSVPAYYYRGMRGALVARFRMSGAIGMWLKIARSWYADRTSLGTGMNEIAGNSLTEVKFQLQVRIR